MSEPVAEAWDSGHAYEQYVGRWSRKVAGEFVRRLAVFRDFDDYWQPFLGKTGAAPTYLASVDPEARHAIRRRLELRLASTANGSIARTARAWAIQGVA